jgi:predicted HAD superfamily Cof-like phosphohydrolase
MKNMIEDIAEMHDKFSVHEAVAKLDKEGLTALLKFRADFLKEELDELYLAMEKGDMDNIVDSIIDGLVVGIGTLDILQVDTQLAWNRVHAANMSKEVGIKASRPNPLGLPDLIKPEGWTAPTHLDNLGIITKIYE